jgi:lambda repressor-like predicted transcriptional regulator
LKANIKRLIKLRGKTLKDLSREMNVPYTGLSHLITDATYKTEKGTIYKYKFPHIRRAVAEFLQVPYYDLWYKEGNKIVTALIEIEIAGTVRKFVEENVTLRPYKNKK